MTRWREDATCDDWGSYVFLRDVAAANVSGRRPTSRPCAGPTTTTSLSTRIAPRFTRQRRRSPYDARGARLDRGRCRGPSRLDLEHWRRAAREIEVTSYAELVLAPQAADVAHPAFSKLFVETEYVARFGAILATRRRRAPDEPEIWAAHLRSSSGEGVGKARVRNRPRALPWSRARQRPHADRGDRRTAALELDRRRARSDLRPAPAGADRAGRRPCTSTSGPWWHRSREDAARPASTSTTTSAPSSGRRLSPGPRRRCSSIISASSRAEASEFQRLAGHLIYAGPTLRPSSEVILRGAGPQSGLWPLSISGDLPIILLRIADIEHIRIARQLLQAMEYWRTKGSPSTSSSSTSAPPPTSRTCRSRWRRWCDTSQRLPQASARRHRRDGCSCCAPTSCSPETCALLASVARVRARRATRAGFPISSDAIKEPVRAPRAARKPFSPRARSRTPCRTSSLEFFNGIGGFAEDGTGICDDPRPRPVDAGPLDQRHRQPAASAFRCRPKDAASPGRSTAASIN